MAIYEHYMVGDDSSPTVYGANWSARPFTPAVAHTVAAIKLKVLRAQLPGTVTVSIRANAASKPTGADLASGTFDGDALGTVEPGDWVTVTLAVPLALTAGVTYWIVVRAPSTGGGDYLLWRATIGMGPYAWSSDSGVNWTAATSLDFLFAEYSVVSDYTYELGGAHTVHADNLAKAKVIPNSIEYSNAAGTFKGSATDSPSQTALGPIKTLVYDETVTSNAIGATLAGRALVRLQRDVGQGDVDAPMNCGQEVWDLIEVIDIRSGQAWTGRVSHITRTYYPGYYRIAVAMGGSDRYYTLVGDEGIGVKPEPAAVPSAPKPMEPAKLWPTAAEIPPYAPVKPLVAQPTPAPVAPQPSQRELEQEDYIRRLRELGPVARPTIRPEALPQPPPPVPPARPKPRGGVLPWPAKRLWEALKLWAKGE